MSYEIPGFTRSIEVAGDISGQHLRFVRMNGAVIAAVTTAATEEIIGVLQNKPDNDIVKVGTVMISGVTMVKANKAITAGTAVYVHDSGRVTDSAVAGRCVGIAETAATDQDDVIAVLLKPLGSVGSET